MAQMQPPSLNPNLPNLKPASPTPNPKFPIWGYFLIALDILLLILVIWIVIVRLNPDGSWRMAWF